MKQSITNVNRETKEKDVIKKYNYNTREFPPGFLFLGVKRKMSSVQGWMEGPMCGQVGLLYRSAFVPTHF